MGNRKELWDICRVRTENDKFSQSLPVHAARGFKLEQHNRQYMQPRFHAARYRALKKTCFFVNIPRSDFRGILICYRGHVPGPKSVKKHSFAISGRLTDF